MPEPPTAHYPARHGISHVTVCRAATAGLGDFVFYSVLVGRAAQYGFVPIVSCYIAVVTGLCSTLFLLVSSATLNPKPLTHAANDAAHRRTRPVSEGCAGSQAVLRKPLPALPISIFLGMIFYFTSRSVRLFVCRCEQRLSVHSRNSFCCGPSIRDRSASASIPWSMQRVRGQLVVSVERAGPIGRYIGIAYVDALSLHNTALQT